MIVLSFLPYLYKLFCLRAWLACEKALFHTMPNQTNSSIFLSFSSTFSCSFYISHLIAFLSFPHSPILFSISPSFSFLHFMCYFDSSFFYIWFFDVISISRYVCYPRNLPQARYEFASNRKALALLPVFPKICIRLWNSLVIVVFNRAGWNLFSSSWYSYQNQLIF